MSCPLWGLLVIHADADQVGVRSQVDAVALEERPGRHLAGRQRVNPTDPADHAFVAGGEHLLPPVARAAARGFHDMALAVGQALRMGVAGHEVVDRDQLALRPQRGDSAGCRAVKVEEVLPGDVAAGITAVGAGDTARDEFAGGGVDESRCARVVQVDVAAVGQRLAGVLVDVPIDLVAHSTPQHGLDAFLAELAGREVAVLAGNLYHEVGPAQERA